MTELEKVARFIARYRTKVAESSVQRIDEFVNWYENDGTRGVYLWHDEIKQLRKAKSKIEGVTNNEDTRYAELVKQDVLAQIQAIQGVKSVVVHTDAAGWRHLKIYIQAYYLFNGRVYNAGYWEWDVPMIDADDKIISVLEDENEYMLKDGTFFLSDMDLLQGILIGPKTIGGNHPFYGDCITSFCFGVLAKEIEDYLKTGDFVSAFQLVSLCLNYVNHEDAYKISHFFEVAKDVNVRDLAEYFGLSDEDIERMEQEQDVLDRLLAEY